MTQYSLWKILGIWLAAAAPMGVLAWLVAPALAGSAPSPGRFTVCLAASITVGLVWQFVLVLLLTRKQPRRDALWLRKPGWLLPIVATLAVGVLEAVPLDPPATGERGLGEFLGTGAGRELMHGNWALYALLLVMFAFNTVLGEELLFRGLLLPRMNGVFRRYDGVANAALFALYHWHQPWSMPSAFVTGLVQAYGSKRARSAWVGIIAHSAQSVVFAVIGLLLVVS